MTLNTFLLSLIVFILIIIAFPKLLKLGKFLIFAYFLVLGISYLITMLNKYKLPVLLITIFTSIFLIFTNYSKIKWFIFFKKSNSIVTNIIKKELSINPVATPRQIFDETVKKWVPLAKQMYPNVKPRELGVKIGVTPKGIRERMISMGYMNFSSEYNE